MKLCPKAFTKDSTPWVIITHNADLPDSKGHDLFLLVKKGKGVRVSCFERKAKRMAANFGGEVKRITQEECRELAKAIR